MEHAYLVIQCACLGYHKDMPQQKKAASKNVNSEKTLAEKYPTAQKRGKRLEALRSNIALKQEEIFALEKTAESLSRQIESLNRQISKNQDRRSDQARRDELQKSRKADQEKTKIESAKARLKTAIEAFIIKEGARIDSQLETTKRKLDILQGKEFVISRSHHEKVITQKAGWFSSEKSEMQMRTQTGRCEFRHIRGTDTASPEVLQKIAAHSKRINDLESRLSDLRTRKAWLPSLKMTSIDQLATDPRLSQSLNTQILRFRELKASTGTKATERFVFNPNPQPPESPSQVALTNQREVLQKELRSVERERTAVKKKIAARAGKLAELQDEVEKLSALSGLQESTQSKPPQRVITQWQDAEILAKDFLVWLGHHDAHLTGNGADGGTDVEGREFVAQVKMHNKPTGRPDVQQLFGIAAAEKKVPIFFAMAFTADAQEWASKVGMEMYRFTRSGQVKQVT